MSNSRDGVFETFLNGINRINEQLKVLLAVTYPFGDRAEGFLKLADLFIKQLGKSRWEQHC